VGVRKSWLRRLAVRCLEWRRFGLGIAVSLSIALRGHAYAGDEAKLGLVLYLDLVSQTCQGIPTRVGRGLIAGALCKIQILTTAGAKSLAVRFAEGTTWQGEQHLLTHHILEQKTALLIIPYFGLIFSNCVFAGDGIGAFGAEDEVEMSFERGRDGFDAAGAEDLEVAGVGGADADVVDVGVGGAVLDEEVGLTFDGEWTYLMDVRGVVEGGEGFVEVEGLVD